MKFTPHYSDNPSKLSRPFSANQSDCGGAIVLVAKKPQYLSYPVTKEWIADVRTELAKGKRGMQERMREYIVSKGIECSSGKLSDILGGKVETSEIVGPVHEFLKWPEPMPPTASRDAGELAHIFKRLTPEQRIKLADGTLEIGELSGEQARDLLAQLFPPKRQ